jgi:transcriptional regulator with XRE-family HTH domain
MIDFDLNLLGQRIRQAREQHGLSQGELADLLYKDQASISEYENGKRKLPITDLPLLAHVLQVPVTYFFGEEITPNDLDKLLLNAFHQLPDPAKPTAIEMLRLLAQAIQVS